MTYGHLAEARTQYLPRGATPWNPRGKVPSGALQQDGCSLVEHWLFGPSVVAGPASTAARECGEHGTRVRGASGPSTLLGPEGTAASVSRT